MIYQELSLAPHLTVVENIFLGRESANFGLLRKKSEREIAAEALAQVGKSDLSLDAKVASLNPAQRQMVEIARALAADARVLIMDEPTSSLTAVDMENLFRVIADLKQNGTSIVYISHFLEEVAEVADRVEVLRDGQTVGGGMMEDLSIQQIINLMVGREIDELFPKVPHEAGEEILRIEDLEGIKLPLGVSFEIHRGEVFGIAGLVGAGRTELLRAVFGLDRVRSGSVRMAAAVRDFTSSSSPASRWKAGIGYVSEDRKEEGLATELSVAENLTLTRLEPYTHFGVFLPWERSAASKEWAEEMQIVCGSVEKPISSLSGGNQQKVAFARLLHHDADLLLLDEPTRGIDVASKAQIYQLIGEAAAAGKAVLVVSSYLPELFGVCDRLAVMRKGTLSEARAITDWTEEEVMHYAIAEN